MKKYDIFAKLHDSIEDFDTKKITLAGKDDELSLSKKSAGYQFSQKDTLELIDLYYNSKFEKGLYDSEGQRKAFLNICKFRAEVAAKQTDIDVKNYVFVPEEGKDNFWKTFFMQRRFSYWAKQNYYGELINELNTDFSKYGTALLKVVGKSLKRVPLRTIRNNQNAKSLAEAVKSGGYVIEEHEMTKFEMEQFKDWKIDNCDYDTKYKVFEMYCLAPLGYINEINDKPSTEADWDNWVMAEFILIPSKVKKGTKGGEILFAEKINKLPYEEVHWEKQDGRWLGIGEVENQFENQIARNFTVNLRRRALLWGAKKVFQSTNEEINKNLVKDVKDGEVLYVGMNGQITQIGMESRNLAEFGADEAVWEKNSDQKSFTYEVVTGESLPSGTPFRLGVILASSVAQHFELKREKFGLFLERSFFEQIIEIFKKDTKEHTLTFASNTVGIEALKEIMIEYHAGKRMLDEALKGKIVPYDLLKEAVGLQLEKEPYLFVKIPANFYDDAKFYMSLQITGESQDTKAEVESLTTLLQMRMSNPQAFDDPGTRKLAQIILSKTGKNLDSIIGKVSPQVMQNAMGATANTNLNANTTNAGGEGNVQSPLAVQ